MTDPAVRTIQAFQAFQCIKSARISGRRIVPLFGSGVSADAGIPTSPILADYIVAVCALASGKGWQDYAAYLRKFGWPHRHDVWSDWLVTQRATDYTILNCRFNEIRHSLYCQSMADEIRNASPLYSRMAKKHFEELGKLATGLTDYRSLLATVTRNDNTLIDAFFDHFTRGRRPSTIHQFIAFLAQLLRIDLILTTNFDPLIERALRDEELNPTVYSVDKDGSVPGALLVRDQRLALVQLHGSTHALRTGYDLDERLPIATLDALRGYLRGNSNLPPSIHRIPLMLVLGYSGSDRRVMDVVSDHIATWKDLRSEDRKEPLVLWISRDGTVPQYLTDAAQSAVFEPKLTEPPKIPSSDAITHPAVLCKYKSGRLFLQDLYQVLERQHAVSRTTYRAIVSVPREPVVTHVVPLDEYPLQANTNARQFRVYRAPQCGFGTSTYLHRAAYGDEFGNHEVIWIDAADFDTRAALIAQLQDEFLQLDRGYGLVTRPFFLRDVDFLRCEMDLLVPKEPFSAQFIDEEDRWENEVAARQVTRALRRGNYVLAIDSLGEFARPHPALYDFFPNKMFHKELQNQQYRLLRFWGWLCKRSGYFGRSVVMLAMTPMSEGSVPYTSAESESVWQRQLNVLLPNAVGEYGLPIPPPSANDARARAADRPGDSAIYVKGLFSTPKNQSSSTTGMAAGLMIGLATLFRRPRSRSALIVTFTRYLKRINKEGPAPAKLLVSKMIRDYLKSKANAANRVEDASTNKDQHARVDFPSDSDLLAFAEVALEDAEKAYVPNTTPDESVKWRLLPRLEGGFYWMHLETRDRIYKMLRDSITIEIDGVKRNVELLDQSTLAHMYDQIALFAINDVYERSQDVSAFTEYVHYRLLSILGYTRIARSGPGRDREWQERLVWLVSALESEHENLLARGKRALLISQVRHVIQVLIFLDNVNNDVRREFLHKLAARLFGCYSALLLASGYPRHAIAYRLWQAELLADQHKRVTLRRQAAKFIGIHEAERPEKATLAIRGLIERIEAVRESLLNKSPNVSKSNSDRIETIEVLIELARLLAEPIMLADRPADWRSELDRHARWNQERMGKSRFRASTETYRKCINKLMILATGVAKDTSAWAKLQEQAALATVRLCHLELNNQSSETRFSWLIARLQKGTSSAYVKPPLFEEDIKRRNKLSKLANDCVGASEFLRSASSTVGSQRIESYLHTIRASALNYAGDEAKSDVCFNRAQAVLRRPAAPGERLAAGIALLAEGEARLIRFFRGYTKWSGPPSSKKNTDIPRMRQDFQAVRLLLDQAEPLLNEGRSENRWRTFYYYLLTTWHYFNAKLISDRNSNPAAEQGSDLVSGEFSERDHLRLALRAILPGLTNTGKHSDRRVVLKKLFEIVDIAGRKCFGPDGWRAERRRAGIGESGRYSPSSVGKVQNRSKRQSSKNGTRGEDGLAPRFPGAHQLDKAKGARGPNAATAPDQGGKGSESDNDAPDNDEQNQN